MTAFNPIRVGAEEALVGDVAAGIAPALPEVAQEGVRKVLFFWTPFG